MAVLPNYPTVTEMEAMARLQQQRTDMLMAQQIAYQAMQGNQLAQYQAMQNQAAQLGGLYGAMLGGMMGGLGGGAGSMGACTGSSYASPAWAATTADSYNEMPPVPPITKTFAPVARVYTNRGEGDVQSETTASAAHRESRDAANRRHKEFRAQEKAEAERERLNRAWFGETKASATRHVSIDTSPLFAPPRAFGIRWDMRPTFWRLRKAFVMWALRLNRRAA